MGEFVTKWQADFFADEPEALKIFIEGRAPKSKQSVGETMSMAARLESFADQVRDGSEAHPDRGSSWAYYEHVVHRIGGCYTLNITNTDNRLHLTPEQVSRLAIKIAQKAPGHNDDIAAILHKYSHDLVLNLEQ